MNTPGSLGSFFAEVMPVGKVAEVFRQNNRPVPPELTGHGGSVLALTVMPGGLNEKMHQDFEKVDLMPQEESGGPVAGKKLAELELSILDENVRCVYYKANAPLIKALVANGIVDGERGEKLLRKYDELRGLGTEPQGGKTGR